LNIQIGKLCTTNGIFYICSSELSITQFKRIDHNSTLFVLAVKNAAARGFYNCKVLLKDGTTGWLNIIHPNDLEPIIFDS